MNTFTLSAFLTKVTRTQNREKTVFLVTDAGEIGHPHAEEQN